MNDQIIAIITEIKDDVNLAATLNEQSNLINDAGLDSLQLINFILRIEDEFGVEIDFESFDLEHLQSVERFVQFITDLAKVG